MRGGKFDKLKGPVRGVSVFPTGAFDPLARQQVGDSASDLTATITNVLASIKSEGLEGPGASSALEELMPEPLRIDVSNILQAQLTLSTNTNTTLLADIGSFLATNNLLTDSEMCNLVQRVLDADNGSIFKKLFSLRSPTVLAFTSRMLESISSSTGLSYLGYKGDELLELFLRYGLDRRILAGPTGGRCLQLALYHRKWDLARLLLRNNVPKNPKLGLREPFDRSPIDLARRKDRLDIVEFLLGQPSDRTQQPRAMKPTMSADECALMQACYAHQSEHIRSLLSRGVNVDFDRDPCGQSYIINGFEERPYSKFYSDRLPLLEWAFFDYTCYDQECYNALLPFSQYSKDFWTVSGILSAASRGQEELEMYQNSRSCPDEASVLALAVSAGLESDKVQEVYTILGLESAKLFSNINVNEILYIAACFQNLEIVVELIQNGADLWAFSPIQSDSLLGHILVRGVTRVLKDLLKSKRFTLEEVFAKNIELLDPLDPWNRHDHICLENVESLVEQGFNVNAAILLENDDQQRVYCTPLQQAIKKRSPAIITCLINAGALINETISRTSHTAFAEAVRGSNYEIVDLLLEKGADVNAFANDQRMTLLELSANIGHYLFLQKVIRALLKAGAYVNGPTLPVRDLRWNTALTAAITNKLLQGTDEIHLIIEAGANVNEMGGGQMARTPLQAAATVTGHCHWSVDLARELLNRGACVNAPAAPDNGLTALQAACENGKESARMIPLLLDAGADVNATPSPRYGRTALQALCNSDAPCPKLMILLIEKGADVNGPASPQYGRTALQTICSFDVPCSKLIALLIKKGADVNAPASPEYGRTALQALCNSNAPCSKLMALLTEKGADVNAPPAEHGGITALQGAAIAGNMKILMLLMDMGADINAPASTSQGRTALDGAAEHGRLDTVQLLLAFGATCMDPGVSGKDSAIRFAEDNGHFVIADVLRGNMSGVEDDVFCSGLG